MGQKVHPTGLRLGLGLGIATEWKSKWYANPKDYPNMLLQDIKAREYLRKELSKAGVSRIQIERPAQNARITVHAARPGVVIGKKGGDVDRLREKVSQIMGVPTHITIEEIRRPDLDSRLVAESIAQQLEKRIMFRRAMKRAVQNALRAGAKGIKVQVGGRLGGAEIARTEWYREGRVPLHTLRADIDYGTAEALTTYGIIGVKVWIFKGEVLTAKGPAQRQAILVADDEAEAADKPKKRAAKKPAAPKKATVIKKAAKPSSKSEAAADQE